MVATNHGKGVAESGDLEHTTGERLAFRGEGERAAVEAAIHRHLGLGGIVLHQTLCGETLARRENRRRTTLAELECHRDLRGRELGAFEQQRDDETLTGTDGLNVVQIVASGGIAHDASLVGGLRYASLRIIRSLNNPLFD